MTSQVSTPDDAGLALASVRDRLRQALEDLANAEKALGASRNELEFAWNQLRLMRLSRAWRITSPLRRLKRQLSRGDHW
jgi:hypothetical protein